MTKIKRMPLFGFHESIAGGLHKAAAAAAGRGLRTFQIFTRNPRGWHTAPLTVGEIRSFKKSMDEHHIQIAVAHMPYLPNLAGNREDLYHRSIGVLTDEIRRCDQLGIPLLVTHLGSHLGAGYAAGLKRIVRALDMALAKNRDNKVMVIMENTAGTSNSMGTTVDDLRNIIERTKFPDRLGICLDTAHAWAGGYKVNSERGVRFWLNDLDTKIGLDKLKVMHLNDSSVDFDSGADRHWHIGEGKIGDECFRAILHMRKLDPIPKILETPAHKPADTDKNQRRIIRLAG